MIDYNYYENIVRVRKNIKSLDTLPTYKKFLIKYPQYKNSLTFEQFKSIISNSTNKLGEKLIENPDGIRLPFNIGYLIIIRKKQDSSKHQYVNLNATKLNNKEIKHNNWNTDDYIARIVYSNYACRPFFKEHRLYTFYKSKPLKQRVSKAFRENYSKYINWEEKKIAHLFKPLLKLNEYNKLHGIESEELFEGS